jgi:excisionase family DNA binding protein
MGEAVSKRINYTDAAELIGVGVGTLRSMVHRKQVPHIRLGAKLVRFDRDELERWLNEHSVPANS